MIAATAFVLPDEKAYWLFDTWERTPLGDRRVRRIYVNRDDAVAVYQEDKGKWSLDDDTPYQIPSFWEYSVAELHYMADRGRDVPMPHDHEPIDLMATWAKELDEKRAKADHRSVIGPWVRKERR